MLKPEDIIVDIANYPTRGMRVGIPVGVKVTHKPTGIFVVEDSERSQHRNREFALQKLYKLVADAQTTGAAELPEALQLADALELYATGDEHQRDIEDAAAELRRLHYENERLAALVEAQQAATHVQNPAEIEHVAGDVSKNGTESNMAPQPTPHGTGRQPASARCVACDWHLHKTGILNAL